MNSGADILVIDDDRDLVNSIRIILGSRGFSVRMAYNGREGYERILEKIPDLIILDVMMSTDTEGFDLAYRLKGDPRFANIPIIMTTGFPQKMAEQGPERFQHILGMDWPVSHLLEKPIDPQDLLNAVESFLKETGKI